MIRLHKFLAMLLMRVSLGTAVQVFMATFRATQLPSASIPFSVLAASRGARNASLGRRSFWLKGLSAAVLAFVLVDSLTVVITLTVLRSARPESLLPSCFASRAPHRVFG